MCSPVNLTGHNALTCWVHMKVFAACCDVFMCTVHTIVKSKLVFSR